MLGFILRRASSLDSVLTSTACSAHNIKLMVFICGGWEHTMKCVWVLLKFEIRPTIKPVNRFSSNKFVNIKYTKKKYFEEGWISVSNYVN